MDNDRVLMDAIRVELDRITVANRRGLLQRRTTSIARMWELVNAFEAKDGTDSPHQPLSIESIGGSDPDFTGDQTTTEYLDDVRGR